MKIILSILFSFFLFFFRHLHSLFILFILCEIFTNIFYHLLLYGKFMFPFIIEVLLLKLFVIVLHFYLFNFFIIFKIKHGISFKHKHKNFINLLIISLFYYSRTFFLIFVKCDSWEMGNNIHNPLYFDSFLLCISRMSTIFFFLLYLDIIPSQHYETYWFVLFHHFH